MAREYRFIKGYPKRKTTLIRRQKRGAIKWDMLRQDRPRIHARPWRYKTRLDRDLSLEARASHSVRGSLQERIFYQILLEHNFIPGVDFTFQSSMLGGRAELGGLVADFIFPYPKVIVQVQSSWHTLSLAHTQRDSDQVLLLQAMGFLVLELWPTVIEDQAALDWWLERNLLHLWGVNRQGLGVAPGYDAAIITALGSREFWQRVLDKFTASYELIR